MLRGPLRFSFLELRFQIPISLLVLAPMVHGALNDDFKMRNKHLWAFEIFPRHRGHRMIKSCVFKFHRGLPFLHQAVHPIRDWTRPASLVDIAFARSCNAFMNCCNDESWQKKRQRTCMTYWTHDTWICLCMELCNWFRDGGEHPKTRYMDIEKHWTYRSHRTHAFSTRCFVISVPFRVPAASAPVRDVDGQVHVLLDS